jgi:hypothetical protein
MMHNRVLKTSPNILHQKTHQSYTHFEFSKEEDIYFSNVAEARANVAMGTDKRHYSDDFNIFLSFMELMYYPKAIDRLLCNG